MTIDLDVVEVLSPPVRLLGLKKTNEAMANVSAFRPGPVSSLYRTTSSEAALLLRLCGVRPDAWASTAQAPTPRAGGGFGDATTNRRVEQAAIQAVLRYYEDWDIIDLQTERGVGYDLELRRGRAVRFVEVKGVAGAQPAFVMTRSEVAAAHEKPAWRLCVVTSALTTPKLTSGLRPTFLQALSGLR